jgi:hypothetical protein
MSYRDPEAARAYQRAWRKAHPERVAKSRELQRLKALGTKRVRCRDKARAYHRKHLYGLTAEAYAALLDSQGGKCAICALPPREGKTLHVDHDHTSGAVRGLLCARCNVKIGVYESPGFLDAAAAYLRNPARLAVMA